MIRIKTDPLLPYCDLSAIAAFAKYDDGFWCIFSPIQLSSPPFAVREDRLREFVSPHDIDTLLEELEDYKKPYATAPSRYFGSL